MGLSNSIRTVVVGDIHGCGMEFISLLKELNFPMAGDRVILVGDYFDRAPIHTILAGGPCVLEDVNAWIVMESDGMRLADVAQCFFLRKCVPARHLQQTPAVFRAMDLRDRQSCATLGVEREVSSWSSGPENLLSLARLQPFSILPTHS